MAEAAATERRNKGKEDDEKEVPLEDIDGIEIEEMKACTDMEDLGKMLGMDETDSPGGQEEKEDADEGMQPQVREHRDAVDRHPEQGKMRGSSGNVGSDAVRGDVERQGVCPEGGRGRCSLSSPEVTGRDPGGDGDQRAEGEEGRMAVGMRPPPVVSQAERDEHNRTHTPFRSWCPHCMRGRGKSTPHMKGQQDEELTAVPQNCL